MTPRSSSGKKASTGNPSSDTAMLFLKEVKRQTVKEQGRMNYMKLRRAGYSEATIEKLKNI